MWASRRSSSRRTGRRRGTRAGTGRRNGRSPKPTGGRRAASGAASVARRRCRLTCRACSSGRSSGSGGTATTRRRGTSCAAMPRALWKMCRSALWCASPPGQAQQRCRRAAFRAIRPSTAADRRWPVGRRGAAGVHQPGPFGLWGADGQELERAHPCQPLLWPGAGPRRARGAHELAPREAAWWGRAGPAGADVAGCGARHLSSPSRLRSGSLSLNLHLAHAQ